MNSVRASRWGSLFVLPLLFFLSPLSLPAQQIPDTWPEAEPSDVKSPDQIISAAFEAISEEQWERFRSLHHPDFRSIGAFREDGAPTHSVTTSVSEGIDNFRKLQADTAFYQRPLNRITEQFGDIAHVFVTFETRAEADDGLMGRGVDSIQLWHDGERWWIMAVLSHGAPEGLTLPERYGG